MTPDSVGFADLIRLWPVMISRPVPATAGFGRVTMPRPTYWKTITPPATDGFGSRGPPDPLNVSPPRPCSDGFGRRTVPPPVNTSLPAADRDGPGKTTPPDPSAETTPAAVTCIAGTVMNRSEERRV